MPHDAYVAASTASWPAEPGRCAHVVLPIAVYMPGRSPLDLMYASGAAMPSGKARASATMVPLGRREDAQQSSGATIV